MNLGSDKRQNVQGELDFSSPPAGEAREARREETESPSAVHGPESPASTNRWMEEICERENLKQALLQVKANKGSAGVDGMTVGGITDYLKQHWPAIREQQLSGTYEPKPVRRVEIPKPDGGVRKLGIPTVLDRLIQQAVDAGPAEAVGLDVLRSQLRFSTGAIGASSSGPGTAVHCRGLRLGG
jgi:RNA-directed DNA polymerase